MIASPKICRLCVATSPHGSVVTRARAESPLALRTPDNHGHAAWVFTSSHGGGLVSGDHVVLEAEVERGATLVLATQASTKAYRARTAADGTSHVSRLDTRVKVADEGLALLLPDPLVPFRGASLVQTTELVLAAGASALVWDPVGAGRVARGERWAFERLETRVLIDGPAGRILTESTRLSPGESHAFAHVGGFEAFACLVLVGPRLAPLATRLLEVARGEPAREEGSVFSAHPLGPEGSAIVRVATTSTSALTNRLRRWLVDLPALLGDDLLARRAF